MTEANFSFTTKFGPKGDLLTVRGSNVEEFGSNLQSASAGLGALLNQFVESVSAGGVANAGLGATPMDPPTTQQAPQQDPWAVSQPPQVQQPQQGGGQWGGQQPQPQQGGNPWGQPQAPAPDWAQQPSAGGAEAWKHDPSIQPPHIQPPQTPWGPAKYKGGISQKNNRAYRMWVDPRPYSQIKNLPKDQQFESVFLRDQDLGL